jgi:hypothetical protein
MNKIITTNLRIPKEDWMNIKTTAGEKGISVNQYINNVLSQHMRRDQLGVDVMPTPLKYSMKKKKYSIWDLPKLATDVPNDTTDEFSDEDKAIYDL